MKYPEDFINKIIQGDCLEVMKYIPNKSIDLVLTDPPYRGDFGHEGGMMTGNRLKNHQEIIRSVGSSPDFDIKKFLPTILEKGKNSLIWCSCKQLPEIFSFTKRRFNLITWVKTNPVPLSNNKLLNDCEYCVCFLDDSFHYPEIPTSEKKTAYIMKNGQDRQIDHPTPKPIELIIKNLEQFSLPGDLVLDPFVGSGTTAFF